MSNIRAYLREKLATAISACYGAEYKNIDPLIQSVAAPHFGDYQANFAMSLAKKLGKKPQQIANEVLEKFAYTDSCEQVTVSGPGFLNMRLSNAFLSTELQKLSRDPELGVEPVKNPYTIIVEYGSPNVAKEMHVGHLRSAII